MESTEWREGVYAHYAGLSIDANPYVKSYSNGSYNDWNQGWRDAEAEAREEQRVRDSLKGIVQ